MKRMFAWSLLALVLWQSPIRGAKYAGDPFSLGYGGRALALGGAVIAGPFDASTGYWNPAGMNLLHGRQVMFMHAETFGSLLNQDVFSYIQVNNQPHSVIHAYGFYFYSLTGGGIKITDTLANGRPYVVREESHGDYLLAAAVSGEIAQTVDFGISAKIIYRDVEVISGKGLSLDAGLYYRPHPKVHLGLMVTDITTGFIRYSKQFPEDTVNYETIYPTVRPGIRVEHRVGDFTGRFLFSADIKFENLKYAAQYWSGPISVDTHYGWEIGYKEAAFGRVGFDIGRLTAGGGVDVKRFTVDFAYLHHSELNETYRVSIGYRF